MRYSLRKGACGISVEYADTYSHNLYASLFEYEIDRGRVTVALSLDDNLKGRGPAGSRRIDGEELAERIDELTLLEVENARIFDRLTRAISRAVVADPREHTLEIAMRGVHRFTGHAAFDFERKGVSWRLRPLA